jgi:hypothetical protein
MSVITTTRTDAKAPAWLDLDALVDPATRDLFDDLASELETLCFEQEELLFNARAALAKAQKLTEQARAKADEAMGVRKAEMLHDGVWALVNHVSGADRLWAVMRHLSIGFAPDQSEPWAPGAYAEGENR